MIGALGVLYVFYAMRVGLHMKNNYIVDISKPPIGPPLRIIKEGGDPSEENDKRIKEYFYYVDAYRKALKAKMKLEFEITKHEM